MSAEDPQGQAVAPATEPHDKVNIPLALVGIGLHLLFPRLTGHVRRSQGMGDPHPAVSEVAKAIERRVSPPPTKQG